MLFQILVETVDLAIHGVSASLAALRRGCSFRATLPYGKIVLYLLALGNARRQYRDPK